MRPLPAAQSVRLEVVPGEYFLGKNKKFSMSDT